jgi:hypothetical protein
MVLKTLQFSAKLWKWAGGKVAWYFVSLPHNLYAEIKTSYPLSQTGFGSIPVEVSVAQSCWKTSIFPDSKSQTYLLPVKKSVRLKEGLQQDCELLVTLDILY